jgi:hypothetical protein
MGWSNEFGATNRMPTRNAGLGNVSIQPNWLIPFCRKFWLGGEERRGSGGYTNVSQTYYKNSVVRSNRAPKDTSEMPRKADPHSQHLPHSLSISVPLVMNAISSTP